MDHAQRVVAILDAADHDAERHDVRELLEADILLLHLAPDRVGCLFAAGDLGLDARLFHRVVESDDDPFDQVGALLLQEGQARADAFARLGLQLGEGQILELVLDLVHAHALGERGINLHRLARDALAGRLVFQIVQRPHVVEPVRELHQQDADIVGHRQDQLAEILRLLGLVGLQFEARELGDAVDEPRDLRSEPLLDILERCERVLDRVVQQPGHDRRAVELHPRQDAGDLDRMGKVGIARGAQLRAMGLHRKDVSLVERVLVNRRVIGFDPLDELELAHHRRGRPNSERRAVRQVSPRSWSRRRRLPRRSPAAPTRRGP